MFFFVVCQRTDRKTIVFVHFCHMRVIDHSDHETVHENNVSLMRYLQILASLWNPKIIDCNTLNRNAI